MHKTIETYREIRGRAEADVAIAHPAEKIRILIGLGTCGIAAGARSVLAALERKLAQEGVEADIVRVGCIGMCFNEPLVDIIKPGRPRISYGHVTPEMVSEIVDDYVLGDNPRPDLAVAVIGDETFAGIPAQKDLPFFKYQHRRVLRNCGVVDPEMIQDYVVRDGYRGLAKALAEMSPEEIIQKVKDSGLRGRGGAGFPTGLKWQFTYQASGDPKYLVCNFDEGDPGAFMNRSEVEGDPHRLLEGMAIAAYAIGAHQGFIYGRAEYPLAIQRLRNAIAQAEEWGFLGDDILGSGFNFHITIKEGAGAFVCGEETALLASIEGRRGMPRPRPPFPAQSGLWGKPTLLNNVGTYFNIALIILNGADWFGQVGVERCKGTKVFSLVGNINRSGLVEVPMGTPLHTIIFGIGGGIPNGKNFKAVQTGGPSGGCIPASLLDLPVDYESLTQAGSIMGSGGMVVMDEDTCMVDIARFFLSFTQSESCGKCVPCRLGTKRMLETLERICRGEGKEEDIGLLLELCETVKLASLCGLGQTAPNPVLSTIKYFRDEYETHIKLKKCPAVACSGLFTSPCQHACPAGIDVPRYVRLIAGGKFDEALELIRERLPLAGVCGYVCPHPCESKCRRGTMDMPIAIRALKRFVADQAHNDGYLPFAREDKPTLDKVAIIGSGPAALSAAYFLARTGYQVTIFEAEAVVGGALATGIPSHRLPRHVLADDIEVIKAQGVEIKTNTPVGDDPSLEDIVAQGYKAIFVATGCPRSFTLRIPGEDKQGIMSGLAFLRDANLGRAPAVGERVAVIGGGNVAIDSARHALRLGADQVMILYRRTRQEMPASEEEITQAEEEGVQIRFLLAPIRIVGDGRVTGIECQRMELGRYDQSGRRRPVPIEGSEFVIKVDSVIPAIGQTPDLAFLGGKGGCKVTRRGALAVDPVTFSTTREGVFAGGDVVTGPDTVVEAIGAGRQAAKAIDEYLGGEGLFDRSAELAKMADSLDLGEILDKKTRVVVRTRSAAERIQDREAVELPLDKEAAIEEAMRCLRCDLEED